MEDVEMDVGDQPIGSFTGLKDKNVLVTGGGSGIGQAVAVRFGRAGANVGINYLAGRQQAETTEDLIKEHLRKSVDRCVELGVETSLVQADVTQDEAVKDMFTQIIDELGGIDFLINNAGIQIPADSHQATTDDFDSVLAVNLRGAFLCAREAIKHFLAEDKKGAVVNISSVHQIIPKPRFVGYACSKGGMQNLTRTLALEYADQGIRVNAVGPGATVTPINKSWVEDPEKQQMVESNIPMGRAGDADEMAEIVAFLCSEQADYITGQTLYVDGGLTLYPNFRTAWSSE